MCTENTNRAMVAVCDILGYSNLVRQTPLNEVVTYHIENIQAALHSSIPRFPAQPIEGTGDQVLREELVGNLTFSDTVILYSLQDNRDGYRAVLNAATILLARHIRWPGLRFRIGISYGDFYAEPARNIYVGRALIEAHELEKRQDWCGAALTDTAVAQIHDSTIDRYYLSQYDVPMHRELRESHMVINWTLAGHEVLPERGWMERGFAIPITETQLAVERKLANTERFHADMCVQCRSVRQRAEIPLPERQNQ